MMRDHPEKIVAELVLIAFKNACPQASANDIGIWSARYPHYAEQIAVFGAILQRAQADHASDNVGTLTESDIALSQKSARAFGIARRAQYEKTLQDAMERGTATKTTKQQSREH